MQQTAWVGQSQIASAAGLFNNCAFDDKNMKLGTAVHHKVYFKFLDIGLSEMLPLMAFMTVFLLKFSQFCSLDIN